MYLTWNGTAKYANISVFRHHFNKINRLNQHEFYNIMYIVKMSIKKVVFLLICKDVIFEKADKRGVWFSIKQCVRREKREILNESHNHPTKNIIFILSILNQR